MMGLLSQSELTRYNRQMMIKGWGEAAQLRLKRSRVAVVGIGGLGSPASLYLAAAGVGYLRLIDSDNVELSNLNRQVLHWSTDLGRPKVESAAMKLAQLNPEISIDARCETISKDTISELLSSIDLVVDGLDNLPTRMLVNSECVRRGLPFVYGAVYGNEGYMTTVIPGVGPCLSCIYPSEMPAPKPFPVLGTAPGVIGNLEATDAIKIITGIGVPAVGRLLVYDGERMAFEEVRIKKSSSCAVCGHIRA
ncbi:MAG: HesA/MoeB/ThiF family protein [Candidatus Methanomethylicia archaeon]|nr:HesA/MoeB/ThiF family protein [Candidatus Methanomethylicia archaeon]